jgi:PhnB protein
VGPCQHGGVAPHRVRPLQHRRGDARPTLSVLRRRCEEAVAFSHKTLGAEVTLRRRFQESPEPPQPSLVPPGAAHKVMQTSVRIGATTVLASDGPCGGRPSVQGFALSLTVPDEAKAESLCAALADGGQVHMPLTTTCFAPRFGMVADRFGVS